MLLIQSNDPKDYAKMRKAWAKVRYRGQSSCLMSVTEPIAQKMPDLDLPTMTPEARCAFQDVLSYERPQANGSVRDILDLARARGFSAHPCDWVPSSEGDQQFPSLYARWASWLADNGYTPYYIGVPLTAENWGSWKPDALRTAFKHFRGHDREVGDRLLRTVGAKSSAGLRLSLLHEIGTGAMFYGLHPDDVPVVRSLLEDRSEKVRALAAEKLAEMEGMETRADHAKQLAHHIKVTDKGLVSKHTGKKAAPSIRISADLHDPSMMRHVYCTDLDTLAEVLGVSAIEFVTGIAPENFKGDLWGFLMRGKDPEVKRAYAQRLVAEGLECPGALIPSGDTELWRAGLEVAMSSQYPFTAFAYLGARAATLDMATLRKLRHFEGFIPSITRELESGALPVNKLYDPVRIMAFLASKQAASELLEDALAAGMAPDNPRLTMLKFNLAL